MELLLKLKELLEGYPGFPGNLQEIAGNMGELGRMALIVVLVLGIANCFFGFRLMKIWLAFVGVLAGAAFGYGLSSHLLESHGLSLFIAAISAVLFGAAAFWIYQTGVFLFCLCAGTLAGSFLFRPTTSLGFFLCILLGAGLGFLGVKFVKPIIIFLTSVQGGMSIGIAAVYLADIGGLPLGTALGAGMTVIGIVVQTHTTREEETEEEEDEDSEPRKKKKPENIEESQEKE